jgi:hypothetical protein
MSWQRRGDFHRDYYSMAAKHGFQAECKWSRASRQFLPFYQELISYFFQKRWLTFHCFIARKQMVRKEEFHNNSWDLARRKHYTMLITQKIQLALDRFPSRKQEFRVYVDRIASSYGKADEAMEVISNNVLNEEFRRVSPVTSVMTRDSKDTPTIQLCDLLLGAVMETWQQKVTSSTKHAIRSEIAQHLGWTDLDSDTRPNERKFNIWYFFDADRESRRVRTRNVKLLYPYP